MRPDLYSESILPKHILIGGRAGLTKGDDLENPRQKEIFELVAKVTKAANVPAEAVIAEGMGA